MVASATANSGSFEVSQPSEEEIRLTRLFDAPKQLVFEVMTRPEHIRQWWGQLGPGYSVPVCEVDLRVGGKWRYAMVTPDGTEVAFHGDYVEIVPDERIVAREIYEGVPDGSAEELNTQTFEDAGEGRTKLTLLIQAPSKDARDALIESGMEDGLQDALDLLEETASSLA